MGTIDYNSIIYSKAEIDSINTIETTRVDTELASKVGTVELGSPSGVATLDTNGKVKTIQLPMATVDESGDVDNSTTVITPQRLHYQIDVRAVSSDKIGAVNGIAPLGADSLIPATYLPAIPAHQTFVVTTLQDMYDLPLTNTVTLGDRAIVTAEPTDVNGDKNGEYVAEISTPASGNWAKLPNLSLVDSVNGQTGAVNITTVAESAQNALDISALDGRVITAEGTLATTVTTVSGHATSIDANTTNIGTNTTDIGDLQILTTTHTADIATNVGDITALDSRVTSIEASHALLLIATSTSSVQEPLVLDAPLQVEFGIAQTTADIDISADGAITFKTPGKYIVSPFFQYGRTGASGTSYMLSRYLVNGTQLGGSLGAKLDNAEVLVPWSSSVQFTANTNDVMTIEIMRDSAGSNSGGLYALSPVAAGWNQAPNASIQIYKAI